MKRVIINSNYVGLVFKNQELTQVLTAGKYWISFWETVEVFNMSQPFLPSQELNVLLQVEELAAMLHVVEIKDYEIALLYKDGNFNQVLGAGKFAFWEGATWYEAMLVDLRTVYVGEDIDKNLIEKGALAHYIRSFRVELYEQGILFINGVMERTLEPGNYHFWKNSDTVLVIKADLRQVTAVIPGQEVLTKDKAQLRINFTVQYKVTDLVKALVENKDFEKQLYTQMQMVLREIVGRLTFDELMEHKDQIGANAMTTAVEKAQLLGVEVLSFGVIDIVLPGDVKEMMNQVLLAEKRAQANIIMRREETASTRSLLNTAKLMEENAMLFKLKEMEYVEKIAEKIHTISLSGNGQIVDQLKQLFVK
ncbi:MAG: slipin family protein [Saprospiraceae bacterium]|nr:slipin family protein [Saprospiraceae bacterium]